VGQVLTRPWEESPDLAFNFVNLDFIYILYHNLLLPVKFITNKGISISWVDGFNLILAEVFIIKSLDKFLVK